jgi:ATPase subunit of ABC transporter with duplicated ATPase domains
MLLVEQKERFSSLRKWFYKVIVKPKEQQSHPSSKPANDLDKEYYEDIIKFERNKQNDDEIKLNETLRDWLNNTKLSVAVTGPTGIGKSVLINTLLETTYEEKKETEDILPSTSVDTRESLSSFSSHSSSDTKKSLNLNNSNSKSSKEHFLSMPTPPSSSASEEREDDLDVRISLHTNTFLSLSCAKLF